MHRKSYLEGFRWLLSPCRRMAIGLLLLPASVTTTLDTSMADRPKTSSHSDDEICDEFVLDVLAR